MGDSVFSESDSVNYVLSKGPVQNVFRTGEFHDWGMDLKDVAGRIKILDTTLRDGEQSPGVSISVHEKIRIASLLESAGVDVIEAGFPIASDAEKHAVSQINSVISKSEVCGLARCTGKDIEAVMGTGVKRVHLFIATSDIHMRHKLKMDRSQVIESISKSVDSVASRGVKVEFSCEDATRSNMDFLKEAFKTARDSGASVLNIPDTVGALSPTAMMHIVKEIRGATSTEVSVHCHNDFGLATANTLFGIMGGATQAHVTVNGIGERAGNASLEEVVVGIESFLSSGTGMSKEKLWELSKEVSSVTGMAVQQNKAIVGENAYAHEAGIHVHGIVNEVSTYEPIDPAVVGTERRIVVGKHSGVNSIRWIMERNGIEADLETAREILREVKKIREGGTRVDEEKVVEMFQEYTKIGGN